MAGRSLNVDDVLFKYLIDHSIREHPAQTALRAATASHRHAGMQISPDQGQFMALLVKLLGVRRAIEIGVFTGYSALTVALQELNTKLHHDERVDISMLAIGDGLTLLRKR